MEIRTIETGSEAYNHMIDLRIRVLLDPIGIPASFIDRKKEEDDIHIAAFDMDKMIGCCVLTRLNDQTVQLRQMAVDSSAREKGTGRSIIEFAEVIAIEKGYKLLMMHARDTVIDFYKKNGYRISGEKFFEVGIGHYRMEKELG
jgi:predicted GNAT family N-acyltransferase